MKYNGIELLVDADSISYADGREQVIQHFPGTDKNRRNSNGKIATIITCRLIALSEEERILIEQILHDDDVEAELEIGARKYKQVVTGDKFNTAPISKVQKGYWFIDATFIALDPIPYDITTGGALY